jgi:two-component system NarL family response regulator
MPKPIRILVVDDHFVVRSGLVASLELEPDLSVIGEADGAATAINVYRKEQPDMVIMDFLFDGTI